MPVSKEFINPCSGPSQSSISVYTSDFISTFPAFVSFFKSRPAVVIFLSQKYHCLEKDSEK
jgi:hypothetical protein